jgi:hypothetical protein
VLLFVVLQITSLQQKQFFYNINYNNIKIIKLFVFGFANKQVAAINKLFDLSISFFYFIKIGKKCYENEECLKIAAHLSRINDL